MAVIVWWLDLQLPMQSVPITTDVVSSDPAQGEVYNMSVTCGRSVVFTGYSGFLHDITEILLKVALNTIGQIQTKTNYNGSQKSWVCFYYSDYQ